MEIDFEDVTVFDSYVNTLYCGFRRLHSKSLTRVQRDRESEFKFSPIYRENILWNVHDNGDLNFVPNSTALLEHHVIPHPICLPGITGEHKVRSLGSEKLTFNCDKKGTMVEEKRLRSNFVMGQDGVLHVLDDVLLPDRGISE
jgi:hypothetical protein